MDICLFRDFVFQRGQVIVQVCFDLKVFFLGGDVEINLFGTRLGSIRRVVDGGFSTG